MQRTAAIVEGVVVGAEEEGDPFGCAVRAASI
jgi:hypothetical protein